MIHAPAFAEEMNKSRHMVAWQARQLAAAGCTVVVPDLCGTGDSPHGLAEADWQCWVNELIDVAIWARKEGANGITLWGLRLGCLLALQASVSLAQRGVSVEHLLLWQPLLSGKLQMAQFLRLVTAAVVTGGSEGQSVKAVKEALAAGETVEVAGYPLSSALYAGMQTAGADGLTPAVGTAVSVIEVVSHADKALLPVTRSHVDSWRDAGCSCLARTVPGAAFWSTQELGFSDSLLEASLDAVSCQFRDGRRPLSITGAKAGLPAVGKVNGATRPLVFGCQNAQLAGRLHCPDHASSRSVGVVIVVGGPQYRIGSHRQFVSLADALASAGYPVLRFDYRGMGDSDGELRGFGAVHEDIAAAIDAFCAAVPGVERVALWGLCDAATASIAYAGRGDPRVAAAVLANPWVYSDRGAASVRIKHYYAARVLSPQFLGRLFTGRVALLQSVRDFVKSAVQAFQPGGAGQGVSGGNVRNVQAIDTDNLGAVFLSAMKAFQNPVLLLLSGSDFTALEFQREVNDNPALCAELERNNVERKHFKGADHTFSRLCWQRQVESETVEFLGCLTTLTPQ